MWADVAEGRISDFYDTLKMRAIEKHRKGRLEHGDDISGLNYQEEITNEVVDICNYYLMDKYLHEKRADIKG